MGEVACGRRDREGKEDINTEDNIRKEIPPSIIAKEKN